MKINILNAILFIISFSLISQKSQAITIDEVFKTSDLSFPYAAMGDFNSDGVIDYAVCDSSYSGYSGAVAIYTQGSLIGKSLGLDEADILIKGENLGDSFGSRCVNGGDIDGDGIDDLLVIAYGNDEAGNNAGAVYLILGSRELDEVSDLSSAYKFTGVNSEDSIPVVSPAGDVNADGYDDFIVGNIFYKYGMKQNTGVVYLVLGQKTFAPTTSLSEAISFSGETKNDYAGYPLATAGDVNGDGYDDFIVGACRNNEGGTDAGAMYLILGSENPVGYNLSEAYKFIGEDDYDNAGYSLAGAGDVNGDGYDDIIVGAYKNDADEGDADGAVYLVFGSSDYKDDDIEIIRPFFSETIFKRKRTFQLSKVAHKFFGENNHLSANTGWSVAGAGDINGDGYADFAIGAPKYNVEGSTAVTNGKIYLFEGGTSYQVGKQTCLDAATRWDDGCLTSPSDSRRKYHAYVGSTSNQAGIFLYMHDYDGDGLSDLVIGGNKNLWLIVNPGLDLETEELP